MASVAAGYLPILLFLIVALGLSTAFVVLPMIVSRFTGAVDRTKAPAAREQPVNQAVLAIAHEHGVKRH